jgi:hypothetical protein
MIRALPDFQFQRLQSVMTTPWHRTGTRILQAMIGCVLLYRLFTELPFAEYLFGTRGIGGGSTTRVFGPIVGGAMDWAFNLPGGEYLLLAGMGIGALGLITGTWTRATTILAMACYWAINLRTPSIGDGGDNITQIVLIYMMFLLPPKAQPKPGLSIWLHNVAVAAIGLQLIIMYFVAGTSKVMGPLWTDGTAMYYIAQVEWFSTPYFSQFFKSDFVAPLSAYATMIYQLAFPFAVFSKLKLPLFAVGVTFHLGILFMMGLVTFSGAMIALELFLISDTEYRWLGSVATAIKNRLPKIKVPPFLTGGVS